MSAPRSNDRRSDRGSVMVVAALAMVALLLFAALAIDVGMVWSSSTQSQAADDAAALAAASKMIFQDPMSDTYEVRTADAIAEGTKFANLNGTVNTGSVQVRPSDFTFGNWNINTRQLDPADLSKPETVTGVRVTVAMDDSAGANKRSPTFLSQFLGINGFVVNNQATAYLGFEGSWTAGDFDVPIAVDSCQLTNGDGCGNDFCARLETATTCPFVAPQSDTNGVICGIFEPTGQQNMCWTAFDDHLTGNKELKDIVDDGNTDEVGVGDEIDLDNGDKVSVIDYLRDKMYGCGSFGDEGPAGEKRYGSTFAVDSWVVKLPVVACQRDDHCAGGDPVPVTGAVCFEIREIVEPSPGKSCNAPKNVGEKSIKGRALCPSSDRPEIRELYNKYCLPADGEPPSGPGGCDYGVRAQRVVLVK